MHHDDRAALHFANYSRRRPRFLPLKGGGEVGVSKGLARERRYPSPLPRSRLMMPEKSLPPSPQAA
ncbi:hypothetical protein SAMN05519103_05044 [Rhizobiales bacterium GAS113]|jgi:hypothetical protein|nr:hypothetical protein SAMN05519103_05044 [Rhizobiales bacterium GAS113]